MPPTCNVCDRYHAPYCAGHSLIAKLREENTHLTALVEGHRQSNDHRRALDAEKRVFELEQENAGLRESATLPRLCPKHAAEMQVGNRSILNSDECGACLVKFRTLLTQAREASRYIRSKTVEFCFDGKALLYKLEDAIDESGLLAKGDG